MTVKRPYIISGLLFVAGLLFFLQPTGCKQERPFPNLVLITIDTLRADHLGAYGYKRAKTPNIDAFADTSVLFERALTVSNNTLPSHLAMLTGRYPQDIGVHRNGFRLPSKVPTIAAVLKKKGYDTAAFISAEALNSRLNIGKGFDVYDEKFNIREMDQVQRRAPDTVGPAMKWLDKRSDKPFFLWIHLFDPHYPYTPPPPYDTLYGNSYKGPADGSMEYLLTVWGRGVPKAPVTAADKKRLIDLYDGEIAYLDSSIRPLLSFLNRSDIRKNTAVAFTADHGESLTEHNYLFDHGEFVYQPSIHIPLMIRFPEAMNISARRDSTPVQAHDIFATFLALAKTPLPEHTAGMNLALIQKDKGAFHRRLLFAESCRPWHVERRGVKEYPNLLKAQTVTDWPFKLIFTPYQNKVELYNLENDPGELDNIARENSATTKKLMQALGKWRKRKFNTAVLDPENMTRLKKLGYVE